MTSSRAHGQGPQPRPVVLTTSGPPCGSVALPARAQTDPGWRGWATWLRGTAILMVALLAAFGFAIATHHGPAGLFEKAASIIVTIVGAALLTRMLARAGRLAR